MQNLNEIFTLDACARRHSFNGGSQVFAQLPGVLIFLFRFM